ncbi:MAG: UDP-glucose 4-epimerase GalE, partial [Gammaproteobacteria bacterium]|nr:UDP-glucose 4-epimerase GalE [Gammaproteobacteria bacterium]
FNLGAGTGTSIRQVIDVVEKLLGVRVPVQVKDRRPGDPAILYADITETSEILGWRPRQSDIRDIISSAIKWVKQEKS